MLATKKDIRDLKNRLEELELQIFGNDAAFAGAPSLIKRVNKLRDLLGELCKTIGVEYFHEVQPEVVRNGFRKIKKQKSK